MVSRSCEEAFGVGGDAEHPLAHGAALDGEAADLALAVDDLFVGEDGAEGVAPPDRGFADVGEAFGVAVDPAFRFGVQFGGDRGGVSIGSARLVAGSNQES